VGVYYSNRIKEKAKNYNYNKILTYKIKVKIKINEKEENMMKKIIQLLSILAVLLIVISSNYAIEGYFIIPLNKWWQLSSISSKLNLTEQEKKSLSNVLIRIKPELIDLEAKIKKEKFKLENMLEVENLNENDIMTQLDNLQKVKLEYFKKRFQYVLEIRKILGLKRFELLKEILMAKPIINIKKTHKHMGHHRHHGKWTK